LWHKLVIVESANIYNNNINFYTLLLYCDKIFYALKRCTEVIIVKLVTHRYGKRFMPFLEKVNIYDSRL